MINGHSNEAVMKSRAVVIVEFRGSLMLYSNMKKAYIAIRDDARIHKTVIRSYSSFARSVASEGGYVKVSNGGHVLSVSRREVL